MSNRIRASAHEKKGDRGDAGARLMRAGTIAAVAVALSAGAACDRLLESGRSGTRHGSSLE